MITFKENLSSLRKARAINQATLAEVLQVSVKTVSHWETGYTEPSLTQLVQLAEFFDVSLDDLVKN